MAYVRTLLLASMALSCAFATDQDTFAPTPKGMTENSPALNASTNSIASGKAAFGEDVRESMEMLAAVEAAQLNCDKACPRSSWNFGRTEQRDDGMYCCCYGGPRQATQYSPYSR
mmetsp:Transcript_38622/g.100050  ORF Transcript_38622/g.100050 Transcript_38622/m.100050 type:complete len:115 (-) Transcript_38622:254-598(-)